MKYDALKHNLEVGQHVIFIQSNEYSGHFNYGIIEQVHMYKVRIRKEDGVLTLKNNDKVIVIDDLLSINKEKYPENFS